MNGLLVVFLISAVLEWAGEHRKERWLIYISKPVALIALMVWVWARIGETGANLTGRKFGLVWFVIGLGLCLVGDVFLMLPERFFLPGLVAFLLGHVAYIVGFAPEFPPQRAVVPGLIVLLFVGVVSVFITRKLVQGWRVGGKNQMIGPVVGYAVVISVMLYGALTTLLVHDWNYLAALPVSLGAVLFYLSDILNAWDRFVVKLPGGRVKIMMMYHLGQMAITVGAVMQFLYRPEA